MAHPPWKEPVHAGKPTPEELVRYKAYLREQLSRITVRKFWEKPESDKGLNWHTKRGQNPFDGPAGAYVRILWSGEWVSSPRMVAELQVSRETLRGQMKRLMRYGYVECRESEHKYFEWRLTAKGREVASQREASA